MKPLDVVTVKGSILRPTATAVLYSGSDMRVIDVPEGAVGTVLEPARMGTVKLRLESMGNVVRMFSCDLYVESREHESSTSTEEYETQSGSEW
jgi:hypothetical protein